MGWNEMWGRIDGEGEAEVVGLSIRFRLAPENKKRGVPPHRSVSVSFPHDPSPSFLARKKTRAEQKLGFNAKLLNLLVEFRSVGSCEGMEELTQYRSTTICLVNMLSFRRKGKAGEGRAAKSQCYFKVRNALKQWAIRYQGLFRDVPGLFGCPDTGSTVETDSNSISLSQHPLVWLSEHYWPHI